MGMVPVPVMTGTLAVARLLGALAAPGSQRFPQSLVIAGEQPDAESAWAAPSNRVARHRCVHVTPPDTDLNEAMLTAARAAVPGMNLLSETSRETRTPLSVNAVVRAMVRGNVVECVVVRAGAHPGAPLRSGRYRIQPNDRKVPKVMPTDYVPTDSGLVNVSTAVPVPLPIVWGAVTLPDQVRQWFGDLSSPMVPGAAVRIDFGDGDFFDAHIDEVRAEEMVRFRWRFLGVGPEAEVRWELGRGAGDTTVTVHDSCPGRPPSDVAQLNAGWRDFLGRLGTYLATGESARYAWREVIDGGTNLPAGTWLPLSDSTVTDWLPIASEGAQPRWFFIVDDDGPRRFAIRDWDLVTGRSLRFAVAIPEAGQRAARCTRHMPIPR